MDLRFSVTNALFSGFYFRLDWWVMECFYCSRVSESASEVDRVPRVHVAEPWQGIAELAGPAIG